ncbi:uncharacterized protein LOC108601555 [Drosophila busckii]|uniref:uncharacterized protein LOC108601555 n=1 Tax=Drosophila busckii TaxID=30019 RepID=UPI001432B682|nr:uncharacterized protein LOC108601555 [Drosophila busckii]
MLWFDIKRSLLLLLVACSLLLAHEHKLNNIIRRVHKEQTVSTLLIMKQANESCPTDVLKLENLPALRLDAEAKVAVKWLYNSEALALVCLKDSSGARLLDALASNTYRMRELRIIILIDTNSSQLLYAIREYANEYHFLRLLVLQTTASGTFVVHRLQPFPQAILERSALQLAGCIFPTVWRNFRGATALSTQHNSPPGSFNFTDRRTGKVSLRGNINRLIIEFASKYNINLRFLPPVIDNKELGSQDIWNMLSSGKVHFGMRFRFINNATLPPKVEHGLLGLSVFTTRSSSSLTLRQLVLVMSFYSLIFVALFNANLSALLTKRIKYTHIKNFEELAQSKLTLAFNDRLQPFVESLGDNLTAGLDSKIVYMDFNRQLDFIHACNTSNAYELFDETWNAVDHFQKNYNLLVFCKPAGLLFIGAYPFGLVRKHNSVFNLALDERIHRINDNGLNIHWMQDSIIDYTLLSV